MNLNTLTPARGSVKREGKRIGRGQGSGKGGTATKGHKGGQSRSGYKRKRGFEGGQMHLQKRIPKFGFKNINRIEYKPINLDILQQLAEKHKLALVDKDILYTHGLVAKKDLVKVLGRGKITAAMEVKVQAFSAKAKEAIETSGGKAVVVK
mgnify:CR=1 FL=1